MNCKRRAALLYSFSLVYLSVEILFRRWFWDQLPTQVSSPLVYAVILANAMLVFKLFRSFVSGSDDQKG